MAVMTLWEEFQNHLRTAHHLQKRLDQCKHDWIPTGPPKMEEYRREFTHPMDTIPSYEMAYRVAERRFCSVCGLPQGRYSTKPGQWSEWETGA